MKIVDSIRARISGSLFDVTRFFLSKRAICVDDEKCFELVHKRNAPMSVVFILSEGDGQADILLNVEYLESEPECPSRKFSLNIGQFSCLSLSFDDEKITCSWRAMLLSPSSPSKIAIYVFSSRSLPGYFFRWFVKAFVANANPLELVRSQSVELTNNGPNLNAPIPAPSDNAEEKTVSALTTHYCHVMELAAHRNIIKTDRYAEGSVFLSFIVPVYNADVSHLEDLYTSFRMQRTGLAELILSDDCSTEPSTVEWLQAATKLTDVAVVFAHHNAGISHAMNAGLQIARGKWVSFVDHDDVLTPFSVSEIVRCLHKNLNCKFLYTDEIITDERLRLQGYFFKPAWDPVLLSGMNYINHLSIYLRERILAVGSFRSQYDGSQDYDMLLRYTKGLEADEILHLPFPAYLWRRSGNTFSSRFMDVATRNARRALAEHFGAKRKVRVDPALNKDLHRVRFDAESRDWPRVSVVIPNKDAPVLIGQLLEGLTKHTDYPNFECVIIDNGSTDPKTFAIYDRYRLLLNLRTVVEPANFNFSAAVNKGIKLADGEFVLLLNNDVEIRSCDWLKEMVACFDYQGVGIVGAKLLYPSGTIQHVGVIAGLGDLAGHWFVDDIAEHPGPMGRFWVRQSLSCVTGACMLISRKCLDATGLFDEINFAVAYNDVDFCLRALKRNFRVLWTPFACLVHHESATRGSDIAPDKIERFNREKANLRAIHRTDLFEDRYYSPWWSRMQSHPSAKIRSTLPECR